MYKIVACWSAPAASDEEAFEEHYREVHAPLAAKVPELRALRLTRTREGLEGGAPAFYRVAELLFESPEAMERSAASEAWRAMREDAGTLVERFGVELSVGLGWEEEERPGRG